MQSPAAARVLRFGAFEADLQARELRKQGMLIKLQDQPFQVLAVLLEHAGEIVTREQLRQNLWPSDTFVDVDNSVNAAINRLREALGDSAESPRYVETLSRRGYRFVAPVTAVSTLDRGPRFAGASSEIPQKERLVLAQVQGIAEPAVAAIQKKAVSTRPMVLLGIITLAAIVIIAMLINRGSSKSTSQPAIRSLAVLPLKNLSGDATQEYLADGMTEAVIGRLAGIHDLRVISRTSVMRFKDTQRSAPEISRTLGVDALVEGSVIREGNRIRVHAQLIRGSTDEHFWSESYDRELRDVLSLESDVAQSIARKVEVTLTGKEHERLTAARLVSPEVYESYLKGRFALNKRYNRQSLEESIRYFEEAIKKDSSFAPAYVGLATAYRRLGAVLIGIPSSETRPKVISAAQKALELDPELAEAHARLADIYQQLFRWSDAEAEYKQALELKPNDAATHLLYAYWLACQGRTEEAVAWSRRARELDPLGTSGSSIGHILIYARHYDEAIHELRSVLALQPDDAEALWYLGLVFTVQGRPEEAIAVLEKALSVSDRSPAIMGFLIRAYVLAGRRADALHLLAELKRRRQTGYVSPAAFVHAYLGVGEYDEAFFWFEQAFQEQSNLMQSLKVLPLYDPLRENPRFKGLLRRVGLN
ncbi:MAG TPA: tetratricopeptide repeat protein [Candidatus Sulfotelmatobacter sp.]|nr:tetratricopeptide repeat protein [Candidatus Sulfotelmatobacter sp.]